LQNCVIAAPKHQCIFANATRSDPDLTSYQFILIYMAHSNAIKLTNRKLAVSLQQAKR